MAFDIADIASLIAYYKADAITGVSDGGNVSSWPDSGPNGLDLSAGVGSEGIWRDAILNSEPVVEFNGTSSRFTTAATATTSSLVNPSAAVVMQLDALQNYFGTCAFDTAAPAGTHLKLSMFSASNGNNNWFTSSYYVFSTYNFSSGYALGCYLLGPSVQTAKINGAGPSSLPTFADWYLTVGSAGLPGDFLDGRIASLVIWDETELCESVYIEGYLAHKYGLTLNSDHPFFAEAPTDGPGGGGGFYNPFKQPVVGGV